MGKTPTILPRESTPFVHANEYREPVLPSKIRCSLRKLGFTLTELPWSWEQREAIPIFILSVPLSKRWKKYIFILWIQKSASVSHSVVSGSLRLPGIFQARILEWVAIPFSRGSSQPRDWTQVSCIAGRFFTIWATREALYAFRKVKVKVVQSCPTLWGPMDYTVHEILQARILEWVAFPFSRTFQPRERSQVSHIARGFFTRWATREILYAFKDLQIHSTNKCGYRLPGMLQSMVSQLDTT